MPQWFIHNKEGTPIGPLEDEQFQKRRAAGEITNSTRIWRTGWQEWTTLGELESLSKVPVAMSMAGPDVGLDPEAARQRSMRPPSVVPELRLDAVLPAAPAEETKYRRCSQCGEQWAEDMLWRSGFVWVCGPCLQKRESEATRRKQRRRPDGLNVGIASWLWRMLLIGFLIAVLIVGFIVLSNSSASRGTLPSSASETR